MPRNGSSVYSLPAGNPVIPGTVIATTWANTTLTDIATALTNSLSTDGSTASVSLAGKTMTGGTFATPTVTGLLTLTGGQIKFPAVQVPSADANTLDDYEEGTWTPVMTYSTPGNISVTYATRQGSYTKIGQVVYTKIILETSAFTHTTAAGNLQVTGIPFSPVASGALGVPTGAMLYSNWNLSGATNLGGYLTSSGIIQFLVMTAASPSGASVYTVTGHTSGTNTTLNFTITYEVA